MSLSVGWTQSVFDVQKMVLKLKEKNIGILITDHNVRETLKIVDRAYLVYDGSILSEGDSDYLINDPENRELLPWRKLL